MPIRAKAKRLVKQNRKTAEALSTASPLITEEETSTTLPIQRKYIIAAVVVLAIIGILYVARGVFVAAIVNGQPISRLSVISELEKQGGKQALNSLITKTLIFQEANKQKITVSKQEVDAEMKKIEESVVKQGQNLNQLLATQGMSRDALAEQVSLQKLIEKMVGKEIQVTDKEVSDYIEKNKETLGDTTDQANLQENVKQQLRQQKLSEKYQALIEKLQKDAKISYFVAIRVIHFLSYPFFT